MVHTPRALRWALTLGLALAVLAPAASARAPKDTLVLGMTLEPAPGLDPTAGAATAIAEVTLYNVYETLTKIQGDGRVVPLLAQGWTVSPDLKTWTFRLHPGVRFHNGEPLTSASVRWSVGWANTALSGSISSTRPW